MPPSSNQIRIAIDEVLNNPIVFDYSFHSIAEIRAMSPALRIATYGYAAPYAREDYITTLLTDRLNALFGMGLVSRIGVGGLIPDIVEPAGGNRSWALEAKHYSPHQSNGFTVRRSRLTNYLKYSLTGPILDANKLIRLGYHDFHILQLQTELIVPSSKSYPTFIENFGFVKYFIHQDTPPFLYSRLQSNLAAIDNENRIFNLVNKSRQVLDQKLIYGGGSCLLTDPTTGWSMGVCIHYLISHFPNPLHPLPIQQMDPDLIDWDI